MLVNSSYFISITAVCISPCSCNPLCRKLFSRVLLIIIPVPFNIYRLSLTRLYQIYQYADCASFAAFSIVILIEKFLERHE